MSDILNPGEPHPAIASALDYIRKIPADRLIQYREYFSSLALSGNRTAEICNGTLKRLFSKELVGDRYFLGLVWIIRDLEERNQKLVDIIGKQNAKLQK